MTMLTQKKLNLQMKILKIAKGLNKFTLPDILPMLEENEKSIQKALHNLESLNQIKKISNTEYLYTNFKKRVNKPVPTSQSSDSDIWLTIPEVARLLNIQEETVKRNCLKGNYVVKPNKEPDLEGKYLIKRSSLKLYDFLEDSERRAMDKEVKKLFHNKEEERLYVVASDRGKEFIYRYLKLFKLTECMNCRELRSFLEIIPLKNPKLKVSYSAFYSKRKKYQTEGMMGIFPKYFMPDYREEEPKVRRNLNRLPKVYNLATTEQIEIIYKCFCFGIPGSQTAKLTNLGATTIETFNKFIRAKIFERQLNALKTHFEKDPQIPRERIFMKEIPIYFYSYDGEVYVLREPLKHEMRARPVTAVEDQELRRVYFYLYRREFRGSMRLYLEHHLASYIWKERNPNFEDQLNMIYEMIHM